MLFRRSDAVFGSFQLFFKISQMTQRTKMQHRSDGGLGTTLLQSILGFRLPSISSISQQMLIVELNVINLWTLNFRERKDAKNLIVKTWFMFLIGNKAYA